MKSEEDEDARAALLPDFDLLPAAAQERVSQFREDVLTKLPGRVIFWKVWGSWSHNCALPTSDVDFLAVYVQPARVLLGLQHVADVVESKKPDSQSFEVGKFARLLLKGNPAVLEMLFTDRLATWSADFEIFRRIRSRMLSRHAVAAYLGYAQAQLKRFRTGQSVHSKGGAAGEKWAYHMARMLRDAERLAAGEPPVVWKEGEERDSLMAIRNAQGDVNELVVDRLDDHLRRLLDSKWFCPPEPDVAAIEAALLYARGFAVAHPILKHEGIPPR